MAYTIVSKKGKRVRFVDNRVITSESKKVSGKLTTNSIEGGGNVNDHFAWDPNSGSLQGTLIGGAAAVAELAEIAGQLCDYYGSTTEKDIIISSLDFSTDSSMKNGFSFTASWSRPGIVSAQYVEAGATPLMSQQDDGKSTSQPVQTGSAPSAEGLQTTAPATVTSAGYADYVNTFNSKPTPSAGPTSRAQPTYSGTHSDF